VVLLAVGAIAGALAGLLAGLLVGAAMDAERGRSVAGYTLGVMPLAALIGASALAWLMRDSTVARSRQGLGALLAVAAAVVVSLALGALRFRVTGATGFIAFGALWYTAEFLMVIGLLPAVAALGAGAASRWAAASGPRRFLIPLMLGALAALLAGPVVIGVAALGGLVTPVMVTVITVLLIAVFRVRLP